jgi:hypothetical protein
MPLWSGDDSPANLVGPEALAGTSRRLVPAVANEQRRRCAARTAGRDERDLQHANASSLRANAALGTTPEQNSALRPH